MKSLASKPQVLENCLVLGSRTTLFFEPLTFCWKTPKTLRKICKDLFSHCSSGDRLKNVFEDFFWKTLAPVSLALASSIPVLGLERVCLRKGCPWPRIFCVLGLESCVLDSTSGCSYFNITLLTPKRLKHMASTYCISSPH